MRAHVIDDYSRRMFGKCLIGFSKYLISREQRVDGRCAQFENTSEEKGLHFRVDTPVNFDVTHST